MRRSLSSLIEGGEQHVRTYIESNVLYFRVDYGEGPGAWLPVSDSKGRKVVRREGRGQWQKSYWTNVVGRAVIHSRGSSALGTRAVDYDLAWGWEILEQSPSKGAAS